MRRQPKNLNMVSKSKKQTLPKHEVDYVFVEKKDQEMASIKLISGPYADIVYHYGNVKFAKEEDINLWSASSKH